MRAEDIALSFSCACNWFVESREFLPYVHNHILRLRKALGGHFWGSGYFYMSVSNVTEDIVRRYVREDNTQRQRLLFN